ncbi:MAG: thioredoxin fold domain-containing protein [Gammaproteobacteria bacterium]|nr:thioredoxin fold domain-containing protein [Gammaproteobacteria bacterium]
MRYLQWFAVLTGFCLSAVQAADLSAAWVTVPATQDLSADAALVNSQHLPLLLVFAQEHCDYCDKLDREVLNPNYGTGAYDGKVIVRHFMIDNFGTVNDFDGKRIEASALSHRFKVYVTPTLLLLDNHGRELVPRIVGIGNMDFFAAYLDQSIAAAHVKLRGN